MFSHILVPLDGSKLAEASLPAARYLAEKFAAKITLFHVLEQDAPQHVHGQQHLTSIEEAKSYLNNILELWFKHLPLVKCHVHETRVALVSESIIDHASELGHDLVVMCSHGRGRSMHLLFGSIAQKIISGGKLPVLITHPDEEGNPSPFNCDHVLVPLDADPEHELVLPLVEGLALTCSSCVHLMTVIPRYGTLTEKVRKSARTLPATAVRMLDYEKQDISAHLSGLAQSMIHKGIKATSHVFRGDPAKVIAKAAADSGANLILLATHGTTGMKAFWEESVAHDICSRSKSPILLTPITF